MTITPDPNAAAAFQRVRDANFPSWQSLELSEAREFYRQQSSLFDTPPTPVVKLWDTSNPSPDGEIGVRVYQPDLDQPKPIFIYLHGGGWTVGDLDMVDAVCHRIARAVDCGVVSVDYRLAPEHLYPAALDDVVAVVTWREGRSFDGWRP